MGLIDAIGTLIVIGAEATLIGAKLVIKSSREGYMNKHSLISTCLTTALLIGLTQISFAVKPSSNVEMINGTSHTLDICYQDSTNKYHFVALAPNESTAPLTSIIGDENVPQQAYFSVFNQISSSSAPATVCEANKFPVANNYCFEDNSNYYIDPFTNQPKTYPAGTFNKLNYSQMVFSPPSLLAQQGGTITIQSDKRCLFNKVNPGGKNIAITPYSATAVGIVGKKFSYDFAGMFDDKVPNPGKNFSNLMVTLIPTDKEALAKLPGTFVFPDKDAKGDTTITTPSLTPPSATSNKITVYACACDPGLTIDELPLGQGGACGKDSEGNPTPVCGTPPTSSTDPNPTWIDSDSGSVGATLTVYADTGVFPLTPDEITAQYTKSPSSQTLLMTKLANNNTVNISSLFKNTVPITGYSVVSNTDTLYGRVNGDYPTGKHLSTTEDGHKQGQGWGPKVIINGADGTDLSMDDFVISGNSLLVKVNNADIQKALQQPYVAAAGGIIIQITVQATTSTGSNTKAYQTFYIMIPDDNNTNNGFVNLINKPRVSAWAYAPTVTGITSDGLKPKSTSTCNLTGTASTFEPLDKYKDVINTSYTNYGDKGLTELTPDIGWIQFNGVQARWPNSGNILSNNATTDPYIGCFANYFKNEVTNPDFKFIVTMEFDGNLKGYVPNLITDPDTSQSTEEPTLSQLSYLAQGVLQAANPIKMFGDTANFKVPPSGRLVDGIQFDVEPLPISGSAPTFYKRVADLLAREGKLNQLFAFADSDTPGIIQAQGPLGIFLPSAYDVASAAINNADTANHFDKSSTAYWGNYNSDKFTPYAKNSGLSYPNYPSSYQGNGALFADKDNTPIDYACHWTTDVPQPTNYLIKSYCNYDMTNSFYNNAIRFNSLDGISNLDFEQRAETFGGKYALAVPGEGSATAWNYVIIYTPRLVNNSGGCDTSKADPCVVPGMPNTYTAQYVGLNYQIKDSTKADYITTVINNYVTSHLDKNALGKYYVFYYHATQTTPTTTPQCSMSTADKATHTMCDAIVAIHNDGTVDQDDKQTDPPLVDKFQAGDANLIVNNPVQQANYTKAIFDLANTVKPKGSTSPIMLNHYLNKPADNPNHNVGVAIYALSDETSTGCQPGGSHGAVPNCLDPQPVGFKGTDQISNGLWSTIGAYMDGSYTGHIVNGSPAPTPTPTSKVKVIANFETDSKEAFTVTGLPTDETCSLYVVYPDQKTQTPMTTLSKDGTYTVSDLNNPFKYATQYPAETYTWHIDCGSHKYSQKFNRYGDLMQLCLTSSTGAEQCSNFDESKTSTPSHQFNLNAGTYTINFKPDFLNNTTTSGTYHNQLLLPSFTSKTVTIDSGPAPAVHLSYKPLS